MALPIITALWRILRVMSVHPGRLIAQSSQLETILAGPASLLHFSTVIRVHVPVTATKSKKGALRLVQRALNSFIINKILRKARRKGAEKRAEISPIRPFSGVSGPFPAPRPHPDRQSWHGRGVSQVWKVWTRYE
jgi:hypothetical protein